MSAIAGAQFNNSPLVVLGGRAPEMRWGSGSLQEIDHVPFVSPLVKSAETVKDPAEIAAVTAAAIDRAAEPPSGPTFVDYPLDVVFSEAEGELPDTPAPDVRIAEGVEEAAAALAGAERPVIMAGTNLYWGRGEGQLRELAEGLGIPVFLNGMGRGCLPADHELCFSRARGAGLKGADVALVIGVPLDFRLGFGGSFGEETKIIQLDFAPSELSGERSADLELVGDIAASLAAIRESAGGEPRSKGLGGGTTGGRDREARRRGGGPQRRPRPLHPMRVYRELREVLDRDAIVIGDGGDFVSYAGRVIDTYEPGCWMDPGPYGCLGAGPGQAIGAKLAHPDRQVCLLLGDGAFGFSGLEFDTMVRHGLPVVGVIGNNGIWGLEKHPMEFLYGYSIAAELAARDPLRPGRRGARRPRRAGPTSPPSCGRRWSAPSPRASRRWSTSSRTPRSSTRASRTWPRRPRPLFGARPERLGDPQHRSTAFPLFPRAHDRTHPSIGIRCPAPLRI